MKTRASNTSSGVSALPPAKRARVTVEDIQDEDDIMSPPSNSSNIDAIGQDSTSSTSRCKVYPYEIGGQSLKKGGNL